LFQSEKAHMNRVSNTTATMAARSEAMIAGGRMAQYRLPPLGGQGSGVDERRVGLGDARGRQQHLCHRALTRRTLDDELTIMQFDQPLHQR
jgi:hypothetical protein